ncbi:MAG: hypothetical protein HeimC3_45550 [Candidatus Heimdallarchaeota archaeon LC_3]|nr:MAG: hypothetical protein HeimC3_45550 [Candidatus Heimdallarchaeota archaeon LC_3]
MNNNHQISFGYFINGKTVSIKVESTEKIENFDKYAVLNDMISKKISSKPERLESQFQDWIKTLEERFLLGLKPGILREELCDLLEQSENVFLPKDKYELITDHIVDKDDLLYNYFEKSVYPLLQT